MSSKSFERWSPLILLAVIVALWELLTTGLGVSEFIFPSPSRILAQTIEFRDVILGHAWRTYWAVSYTHLRAHETG
jgi:NitT/TauT family transport system permease protein